MSTEAPARTAKEIQDALAMPPPPLPVPPPSAQPLKEVILEPELEALQDCLKNAVAQTGLIYKFHATTHKSGISNVHPPQSLTAALGREIEKYDQICDSLEAQILRAISVLQRDLAREQKKIADEEAASLAQKEPEVASPEAMDQDETTVSVKEEETQPTTQTNSPVSATHPGRRPSAISISSLHRPAFPHKLDLSSVSFRLPTEDSLIQSVTLAPKSARDLGTNELQQGFLSSFTGQSSDSGTRQPDIDLTLPDILPSSSSVDLSAGDSSDKPIELDLDGDLDVAVMSNLFGETGSGAPQGSEMQSDGMFPEGMVGGTAGESNVTIKEEHDFFNHLDDGSNLGANSQQASLSGPSTGGLFNPNPNTGGDMTNIGEHGFDFTTIDLTHLDDESLFDSGAQNPDLNFSVDFTMADVANEPKDPSTSNP